MAKCTSEFIHRQQEESTLTKKKSTKKQKAPIAYEPCTVMVIYKCSKHITYSGAIGMPEDIRTTIPKAQNLFLSSDDSQLPICL
jgi:hypothetical protein